MQTDPHSHGPTDALRDLAAAVSSWKGNHLRLLTSAVRGANNSRDEEALRLFLWAVARAFEQDCSKYRRLEIRESADLLLRHGRESCELLWTEFHNQYLEWRNRYHLDWYPAARPETPPTVPLEHLHALAQEQPFKFFIYLRLALRQHDGELPGRELSKLDSLLASNDTHQAQLRRSATLPIVRWKRKNPFELRKCCLGAWTQQDKEGSKGEVFEAVQLDLDATRLRHATTIDGLIAMIQGVATSDPPALRFEGQMAQDQYVGAKLAWFGVDLTSRSVDAQPTPLQQFLEDDSQSGDAINRAKENRYGCAVLSFPLRQLLHDWTRLHALGIRQYASKNGPGEESQTILADCAGRTWYSLQDDDRCAPLPGLKVNGSLFTWPAPIRYMESGLWSHPEFAVVGGFSADPGHDLKIRFVKHRFRECLHSRRKRKCDCSWNQSVVSPNMARELFIQKVIEKGCQEAVINFQTKYSAFSDDKEDSSSDWQSIHAGLTSGASPQGLPLPSSSSTSYAAPDMTRPVVTPATATLSPLGKRDRTVFEEKSPGEKD